MTVLHLRSSVYPGGPETTLLGWLRYADSARFEHRVLFFDEKQGLHLRSLAVFQEHGVPVHMVPWAPGKQLRAAVDCVRQHMPRHGACIVHSHDVRSDFIALVAARRKRARVVVSNHAWHAQGLKRHVQEALRARWLPWADLVVNVSEDTHRETLRRGVPAHKSVALYSGLDLAPYQQLCSPEQARAQLGLVASDQVVCNVARMWPEKAIDTLFEAVSRLLPRYPRLKLLQVGDGPLLDTLTADVQRRGLQDTVRLLGFRTDFPTVMRASDIFALPSLAEGMPMVIYSAMALGMPIVTSDVNGMRDVLQHEATALIMRPGHVDDLTQCLERLLSDPALAHRLGQQARQDMERRFSAESTVRQLERLYTQVLGPAVPPQALSPA